MLGRVVIIYFAKKGSRGNSTTNLESCGVAGRSSLEGESSSTLQLCLFRSSLRRAGRRPIVVGLHVSGCVGAERDNKE